MARDESPRPPFQGFRGPNYTMVPDEVFDELMVDLTGAELKTLLYIIRRTFGFKKDSDNISLSQMLNGVTTRNGRVLDRGVGLSKKTLLQALRSLEERNIIQTERRQSREKGNEPTSYRLNVRSSPIRGETLPPLEEKLPQGVETNAPTPLGELFLQGGGGKTPPPSGEKILQGGGGESVPSSRGRNSATQDTVEQHTERGTDSNIRMAHNNDSVPVGHGSLDWMGPTVAGPATDTDHDHEPVNDRREPVDDEARDIILEYMHDFSREFRDQAPLRSTTTRAVNLYHRSGQSIESFVGYLYRARSITKERSSQIRATVGDDHGSLASKNRTAYFFAVLEDLLGLRGETS